MNGLDADTLAGISYLPGVDWTPGTGLRGTSQELVETVGHSIHSLVHIIGSTHGEGSKHWHVTCREGMALSAQLVSAAPGSLWTRPGGTLYCPDVRLFKLLQARDKSLSDGHTQHCPNALDPRYTGDVRGDGPVF